MLKIDFVIPWVDGSDCAWQEKRNQFDKENISQEKRYRDWGTLKYWFRAVETNAPWVNRIFLITDGQIPEWLNKDNPKLCIIDHKDYLPKEYRPTFSSHVIELNLHRIDKLSEHFVYFNDDTFVMNPVKEKDFFKNGLPVDMAVLYPGSTTKDPLFDHILLEDAKFFDRHYNIKKVMSGHWLKWHHPIYGKSLLKTLSMKFYPGFTGFMLHHQPTSLLKECVKKAWDLEPELLDRVSKNPFRTIGDVNQYIFRYIQLGEGKFAPYNVLKRGTMINLGEKSLNYDDMLQKYPYKLLCLNDEAELVDYAKEKKKLLSAMERKFQRKSSFEK